MYIWGFLKMRVTQVTVGQFQYYVVVIHDDWIM